MNVSLKRQLQCSLIKNKSVAFVDSAAAAAVEAEWKQQKWKSFKLSETNAAGWYSPNPNEDYAIRKMWRASNTSFVWLKSGSWETTTRDGKFAHVEVILKFFKNLQIFKDSPLNCDFKRLISLAKNSVDSKGGGGADAEHFSFALFLLSNEKPIDLMICVI